MSDTKKNSDLQDVVEDATGFNLRSLKTLLDLFVRPNRVFRSYAARERTYTPAIRIWLGLVGLQVLISALWGGWAGVLRQQIEAGSPELRNTYEELSQGRLDEFVSHYADAVGLLQPVFVAAFTALGTLIIRGVEPLPWSTRLNIAMGVLSVGTLVGIATMPWMMSTSGDTGTVMIGVGITALAYFATFLRGAPDVLTRTGAGAFGKATFYTTVLMLLVFVSGIVLSMVSGAYAAMRING